MTWKWSAERLTEILHFRMTKTERNRLLRLATDQGVGEADALRQAVRAGLATLEQGRVAATRSDPPVV